MAKDLTLAEGIENDSDFPSGVKLQDGQTVVNSHINQDIVQFFQKMMKEANITPNGQFDNEANTYQFLNALYGTLRKNLLNGYDLGGNPVLGLSVRALINDMAVDAPAVPYKYVSPTRFKDMTAGVRKKIIAINEWDMDFDNYKFVPHGLPSDAYKNIRDISVIIFDDNELAAIPLNAKRFLPTGGVSGVSNTDIVLVRDLNGFFDSQDFSSTSINRGFITIDYIY